jgi:hypothetical protein
MPSAITAAAAVLGLAILPLPGGQSAIERHNLAIAMNSNDTASENGIRGQVNIRPVRPHATLGTPNFAPYQTKLEVSDGSGHVVANIETDGNGQFRKALPPGTYILKPLSPGPYPRATEQTIVVSPGKFSQVTITYDSGIR